MKKSRILDLTSPLTEKSIYKVSSQGKAWGSDLSCGSHYPAYFSLKKILEEQFPRRKRRTDPDLIYQIGNPTLGALSYLCVEV